MQAAGSDPVKRNNVRVLGKQDARDTLVFVHGFGTDQSIWANVIAPFLPDYRIVLLDHVGAGSSAEDALLQDSYLNLKKYARDLVEVCETLQLREVVLIGHSVGAMIAALATLERPLLAWKLVLLGCSPCYRNDADYRGGMTSEDITAIYDGARADFDGWTDYFGRQMMGNSLHPQLAECFVQGLRSFPRERLLTVLCSILHTDYRREVGQIRVPTLILQAQHDPAVPREVADYLHRSIHESTLVLLDVEGHLPHVTAPALVIDAIRTFLSE